MSTTPAVVTGTVEGTGSAINVVLGFLPKKVQVFNIDDAGTLRAEMEWVKGMENVAAIAGGIKTVDTPARTEHTAAQGISEYAGEDDLIYDGDTSEAWEDAAGSSVEASIVDVDGACYGYQIVPTPSHGQRIKSGKGFTIGTDADLNVSAETMIFIAYR